MPVITFASSKGGVGRTTSAIILATTLARKNRVVVIDTDPAKRLLSWANKAPIPARLVVQGSNGERHIHGEIEQTAKTAAFVIIDTKGAPTKLNAIAMAESDLVIIPMGDEQQDAEEALQTLAAVALEARAGRKEILGRVLFARTNEKAIKSRLARFLNQQVRDKVGCFTTELAARSAFSSLNNHGGTLYEMDVAEVGGVAKAIANAELFAEEVIQVIGWQDRDMNPVMQMSIRIRATAYDRFRAHCLLERQTNGDMLEAMMRSYEELQSQIKAQAAELSTSVTK